MIPTTITAYNCIIYKYIFKSQPISFLTCNWVGVFLLSEKVVGMIVLWLCFETDINWNVFGVSFIHQLLMKAWDVTSMEHICKLCMELSPCKHKTISIVFVLHLTELEKMNDIFDSRWEKDPRVILFLGQHR